MLCSSLHLHVICRWAADVPDPQQHSAHHQDRPAHQPEGLRAGQRAVEQQSEPQARAEVMTTVPQLTSSSFHLFVQWGFDLFTLPVRSHSQSHLIDFWVFIFKNNGSSLGSKTSMFWKKKTFLWFFYPLTDLIISKGNYLYLFPAGDTFQTEVEPVLLLCCVAPHRRLKMDEFIPTTFRMDLKQERETFFTQQEGKVAEHQDSRKTTVTSVIV